MATTTTTTTTRLLPVVSSTRIMMIMMMTIMFVIINPFFMNSTHSFTLQGCHRRQQQHHRHDSLFVKTGWRRMVNTKNNNKKKSVTLFNSNDDDDMDDVDRHMGRIGWGKTVLTESESVATTTIVPQQQQQQQQQQRTSTDPESVSLDRTASSSSTTRTTTTTPTVADTNEKQKMTINIALTREDGKNEALANAIYNCNAMMEMNQYNIQLQSYEVPCIQHADGPDYDTLRSILVNQHENQSNSNSNNNNVEDATTIVYDYIIITSPEAARVLASVWPWKTTTTTTTDDDDDNDSIPPPKVVAVGKATELVLRECNIDVAFVPSKATAQTLVEELPSIAITTKDDSTSTTITTTTTIINVLYPASAKAADVIVNGLENNNRTDILFHVNRLDTYDTIPTLWDTTQQQIARSCHIVSFASPSAIKGWLSNIEQAKAAIAAAVDDDDNTNIVVVQSTVAACIGETSATACRKLGNWEDTQIFYPKEQPGMDGWMDAIMEAAAYVAATESSSVS